MLVGTVTLLAATPTLAENLASTPEQSQVLYVMQEKCGKNAAALFEALFFDKARTNGLVRRGSGEHKGDSEFQNHYSTKFNKCFMWTYTTLIDPTTTLIYAKRQHLARARRYHHVSARRHRRRPIRTRQTKELMTVWDVNDNRMIANFVIIEPNKRSRGLEPHAAWCWVVKPEKLNTFDALVSLSSIDPLASSSSVNVNFCALPSEGSDIWLQWNALIKPYMQDSQ